jgi:hypothetical protein
MQSRATAGLQERVRGATKPGAPLRDALAADDQTQLEQFAAEQTPRPGTVSRVPDCVLEES